MATCYHCMVCKWIWYRLPERLPQHQTRKSIDICLISFLVITVSKSTEYTEQVHHLARSWSAPACNTHPPTHSRHSTVDLTSFPATVSIPKLPSSGSSHDQPGRNGSVLKSGTVSWPQHDSTYFIWLSHSASFHCSKNRRFPTWCSSRKHSTHPCSFYHFPSGSSAECKVSRCEGQALSRCASVWRRYQRNDILGIARNSRNGSNSWLVAVFLVSYRKCMHRLIYLDSVVMCTHTSACRWPL